MQAEKDYGSCEAQRDKILSYVKSQEDLERPALKALPFGYNLIDKKLVIDNKEAAVVKQIFERFVKTRSLVRTMEFIRENNFKEVSNKADERLIGKMVCPAGRYVQTLRGIRPQATQKKLGPSAKSCF